MVDDREELKAVWGRIAHIDLTAGQVTIEEPEPGVYRRLAGGRALGAHLLLKHMPAGVDPLSPGNLLIFAPGILQGTNLPGSGRHGVAAKSPLTGAIGSSEAGGWWGHEMKLAGYDALVIHGKADKPVYIWLKDGEIAIRPAEHLWGKETAETEELIRGELGDARVRVACIGPAGERLVRFSAIMHDVNRAAGRNGLGAVMGSKNLKAVAVRGALSLPVAQRARLQAAARWLAENYKQELGWAVAMGTPAGVMGLGKSGGLPTRAFRDALFETREGISGQAMQESILKERDTCMVCPIKCKQVVSYHDPEGRRTILPVYGGPEYETLAALGSNCCVDDLIAVAKANERCAAYGLDTISTGMVISYVMECAERSVIDASMTDGYMPAWGDGDAMLAGIELIAGRSGFGDKMAEGVARLACLLGGEAQEFALHIKGQELPMHEPRLKWAMGLGYAVAPVGADHMMNIHDTDYAIPTGKLERVNSQFPTAPLPPRDLGEEKMQLFFHELNWMHFLDCAVVCQFYPYRYEHLAGALSDAAGVEFTERDLLEIGERAQTLSRLFNYREGFRAADDRLPKRVMSAFAEGPLAGVEITQEVFLGARRRYYELMGWDPETGEPLPSTLERLGLKQMLA